MHEDDEQFSHEDAPRETHQHPRDAVSALPQWRVLLHDDEVHDRHFIIERLTEILPLTPAAATQRVLEAYRDGVATLVTVHQELAELYYVLLAKQNLIVTIERA